MFLKNIYCLTIILSICNNVPYLFLAFQHLFKLQNKLPKCDFKTLQSAFQSKALNTEKKHLECLDFALVNIKKTTENCKGEDSD